MPDNGGFKVLRLQYVSKIWLEINQCLGKQNMERIKWNINMNLSKLNQLMDRKEDIYEKNAQCHYPSGNESQNTMR